MISGRATIEGTRRFADRSKAAAGHFRQTSSLSLSSIGVGTSQAAALIPGISRSGFTMGGGLLAGLSNEDAARYGFLLATPVIFAAAALKLPELFGSAGNGVRGPALVAGLCAAATTFFAVKFLLRFFQSNRLTPFGVYCLGFGVVCTLVFALGG